MPVIGTSFKSIIGVKKKSVVNESITTNSTPKVLDVKERNLENLGKKALVLSFEFLTNYTPDIGEVKMEGELLYLSDQHEDILKNWKKNKKLSEDVSIEILNSLFRLCLLKSADLANQLQLPIPIRLPIVTKSNKQEKPEDPAVA